VVDEVHIALDVEVLGHVVVDEVEILAAEVLDVLERPGVEVVYADDAGAAFDQVIAEMRAEKAGSAGDDRGGHRRDSTGGSGRWPQSLRRLYKAKCRANSDGATPRVRV
jgi:hypothetical protein